MKPDKTISPSAFIPFCELGGNMSAVGENIQQFDVPVCNIFKSKIQNDQLCYEADLKKFANKNIDKDLELGFTFLMDYNEDRQVIYDEDMDTFSMKKIGLTSNVVETNQDKNAVIYMNTIGKLCRFKEK